MSRVQVCSQEKRPANFLLNKSLRKESKKKSTEEDAFSSQRAVRVPWWDRPDPQGLKVV